MTDTNTLEGAVREAKRAAGLDPDKAYHPTSFVEHLPAEWHDPFWRRQVERYTAGQGITVV